MKYRCGLYIRPRTGEVEEAYRMGFDAVFTSPSREVALRARELGLLYFPLVWVPKASYVSQGVVDAWGEVKLFAFNNSGCIMNPSLMQNTLNRIEEAVRETDGEVIILDALRFPSPHDAKQLFSCFCKHCQDFMRFLNINSEELAENVRQAARNIHLYPHLNPDEQNALQTLFYVRQRAVERVLIHVREFAEKLGVRLWAAVFPPSLAWMVGQNYSVLRRYVDQIQVMLYHSGRGAACLNHELASLARLISKLSGLDLEDALKFSSYLTGIEVDFPFNALEEGLPLTIICDEFLRAKRIIDDVVPIFWFDVHFNSILREMKGFFDVIAVFKPGGL